MADVIESATPVAEQVIDNGVPQELREQMNLALGITPPPVEQSNEQQAAQVVAHTQETVFSFDKFKADFGYEKPEDVFAEITELRNLKANPPQPQPQEIKFENEVSKTLFEALQAGKLEEVYSSLNQQMLLNRLSSVEVSKETAPDIVKTGMQLKYKDLTADEINYKFNKQYGIPPKPVQGSDEMDEDFQTREQAWQAIQQDKMMELLIDAKLAKPELESAKAGIKFPTVEKVDDPAYQAYLEYQKSIQDNNAARVQAYNEYKTFTPESIEAKLNFKDENNKIDFDFNFKPDGESFSKAIELASDVDKFFDTYTNSDGTPNRKRFLEDIYFAMNKDKIIREAINQGKNAMLKASLPDNSGNQGMNRQPIVTAGEPSELDKQMQLAGVKKSF